MPPDFRFSHFHLNSSHFHFPKELELAATAKDPGAPLPEGSAMTPAVGAQLVIPAGLPRNLEAAIQRCVLISTSPFSQFIYQCLGMGQQHIRPLWRRCWIRMGS